MAGSLVPDVGNVSINTTGALKNLMDASRDLQSAYMTPVNRLERYAKEDEFKDRLDREDALRAEALAYSRGRDAKNDLIAQEERDYILGQRKNKEDFMKSISDPSRDALDDTILKRTNELAAAKWNENTPISDTEASRLNDYYARNEQVLSPTLDQENLRSYIGSQALKYGVDLSTATSTYEMFKPDKKDTGLTDMEKLLIQNELGMQRDVNKLNAEKALGNEKYDGKTGNTTTGAKKDKAGAIGSDFASNAAELNKLELDTDVIDALGATSEKEKALGLYTNLSKTYSPKDVANVIKASVGSNGEINETTMKSLLANIPTSVSVSDKSNTGANIGRVEYQPSVDLQSMISKGTKVDKGQLAEDMFEREFGIPKGKTSQTGANEGGGRVPIADKNGQIKRIEGVPDSLQVNEGLKLKAYDDAGGLAVGYGYNYSTKSTDELKKDFKAAGLSDYLLEDAASGKKITLTRDEADRLAQVAYKNHGTDKAGKFIKNYKNLDPLMQEVAADMAYRGDLVPGENSYRGTLSNLLEQGDINKLYEYVDNSSNVPQPVKNRLGNILTVERDRTTDNIKDLFGKVEDNLSSKAPDKIDEVISGEKVDKDRILENYSSAKLMQDSGTNQYGGKEWVASNIDTGRYVDIADKAKGYSSKIANVNNKLRDDGFKDTNSILELISYMPEGKDKDAVANVYHYKMMQSNSEDGETYRKTIADKQLSDAGWLAASVITSAVPIGAAFKGASVLKNAASTKAAKTATSKAQAELAKQATKRKLDDALQSKLNLEKRLDELSLKKNTKDVANETRKLESEWKRVQDYINNLK